MNKRNREKLTRRINEFLAKHAIRTPGGIREWVFPLVEGSDINRNSNIPGLVYHLTVHIPACARGSFMFHGCFRFSGYGMNKNAEYFLLEKAFPDINIHSGKWNWYISSTDSVEAGILECQQRFRQIHSDLEF